MVKTKTTKTKAKPKVRIPPQLSAALYRLDEAEKFQAALTTRLEIIEKHVSTTAGKVDFIIPSVGNNTSHTAQLDTIILTAAKELEEFKSWRNDITNQWRRLVREELQSQLNDPDRAAANQDVASLTGMMRTLNQKIDQLGDRVIRIERKYLIPKDIVLPQSEADRAVLESITSIESKANLLAKRLTTQAADLRDQKDMIRSLGANFDDMQSKISSITNQATSSQQQQS